MSDVKPLTPEERGYPHEPATDEEIARYERGAAARWRGDQKLPLGSTFGASTNCFLSVMARFRAVDAERDAERARAERLRAALEEAHRELYWRSAPIDAQGVISRALADDEAKGAGS